MIHLPGEQIILVSLDVNYFLFTFVLLDGLGTKKLPILSYIFGKILSTLKFWEGLSKSRRPQCKSYESCERYERLADWYFTSMF